MKKIIILSISFLMAISTFAAKEKAPKMAKKATKTKINGEIFSYFKLSHLNSPIVLESVKKITKKVVVNYKKKGNNYQSLNDQLLELKAWVNDEKYFELNTKLSRKWVNIFIKKGFSLKSLGEVILDLNDEKKLKTPEGKKAMAEYLKIAKQMIALSKKPAKANKTEYLRQKKVYSLIMKKKAANARAKARSRKINNSNNK